VDHLGAFYKIHRSSAARWLSRARDHLLEETRSLLLRRLKMTDSELESLMRAVTSRLDLSMKHLFSSTVTSPSSNS
jgi:RNA polymerase sigma-70 factor (ECF subfamily)